MGEQTPRFVSCLVVGVPREPREEKGRPAHCGARPGVGLRPGLCCAPGAPCCFSPRQEACFFSQGRSWCLRPFSWPEGALGTCPAQRVTLSGPSTCTPTTPKALMLSFPSFLLTLLCSVQVKVNFCSAPGIADKQSPRPDPGFHLLATSPRARLPHLIPAAGVLKPTACGNWPRSLSRS